MVVFLMETKSNVVWVKFVCDQCGFKDSFIVPSDGFRGGLALFWPMDKNVNIQSFSNRHIDAIIDHGVDNA